MALTEQSLLAALASVRDIYTGEELVAARRIVDVHIGADGAAAFTVLMPYPAASRQAALREQLVQATSQAGATSVDIAFRLQVQAHAVQKGVQLLPQVRNIIAVASGKGGVGKSTTAVNLALALAAEGASVGILDADIYGPSLPMMLGIDQRPDSSDGKTMQPLERHGVQAMSIGFLVKRDDAMVWRGPMAVQALEQMLRQTNWRDLDYLIVDMPPGTGDIQLSLSQRVPLTGAVIVSTPQDIALLDARKGIRMFEKVGVPILGLVENMAVHVCSQCGHQEHIFGADGGKRLAEEIGIDYLGALPLDMQIRLQADGGTPSVVAEPQGAVAEAYLEIARTVSAKVARQAKDYTHKFPTITISQKT
ncbi:iron-sulfur cluster carrier protein ApbC [Corticibacter populi]|uniref:Iron-sulfur cluster carrier protein n=1 Tax=Corticibacter populi TaxID=1550736 RepID=A0A3M6QY31_9BURK|nr:iron-sulfur cluster carrier protein ApbC [Corticibacter populi]RMX07927.1 iron-sulfur cluster carrier protein ApbC [Corticibacter populi]RZS35166.1 ATP-binding protein involved in chromosome partitioning [Corticibacter populi]